MNVQLKKRFEVLTGQVYQGRYMTNRYSADLDLLTVSEHSDQQNIAYDRMKFWMYEVLQDSILISDRSERLVAWGATDARILALPEEPVDQIVGIMLYLKLNAIMENRMVVTRVSLASAEGDNTYYIHNHGEGLGALGDSGWWADSRPCWILPQTHRDHGKIVTLDRVPEWVDHDLGWADDHQDKKDTVVFADFRRDADE